MINRLTRNTRCTNIQYVWEIICKTTKYVLQSLTSSVYSDFYTAINVIVINELKSNSAYNSFTKPIYFIILISIIQLRNTNNNGSSYFFIMPEQSLFNKAQCQYYIYIFVLRY